MTTAFNVAISATINPPTGDNVRIGPTELVYNSSRYDEAAMLEVTGVAENATDEELLDLPLSSVEARSAGETVTEEGRIINETEGIPVPETSLLVSINGTRIGSGTVDDIAPDGEGLVTVTAFDGVRKLLQNSMTVSFQEEAATDVFRAVFEYAGIPSSEDDPGSITGRPVYRIDVDDNIDITREFTSTPCAEIMNVIARDANWYWYADEQNVINVRAGLPSERFDLEYVTESSAGKQTPPWQTVVVTGGRDEYARFVASDADSAPAPEEDGGDDSDTSNDNTGRSPHMLGRDPVRGVAGEGTPVFEHHDQSITTQANAQNVAEGILEEFLRQQATGTVTVVGDPEIQPLDAIRMPPDLGGAEYVAGNVSHRVNTSEGYLTEIGCEGLIDAGPGLPDDDEESEEPEAPRSSTSSDGPIDLDSDGQVG